MANLGMQFDPNSVEAGQFDPLPVGDYVAQIIESEVKPTKNQTGLNLAMTWQVTEGECENRRIWQNINFQNNSQQAQTIGQQQLKAICDAVGFTGHLEDSEVLHNQPCRIRVGMGKANNGYPAKEEVKSVKPMVAAAPAGKSVAQAQQAAPAAAGQAAKPAANKPAGPTGARPWAAPGRTAAA